MKFKQLIPYILVFITSFLITPVAITSFVKKANENAKEYVRNFTPFTSDLPNGIYEGKYKAFGMITMSKVQFEIEDGLVKSINFIKMFHSPGSIYKENIETQIKQTQKLEVDAITGATRTSNFAKAAIKDAVEKKKVM
jgi:uncharacterized protein with FMN-binding domain